MDSRRVVENIVLAKEDNARWLQYAKVMVLGPAAGKVLVPAYTDNCPSYAWLYAHSQEIMPSGTETGLPQFEIIDQVEALRYELQCCYLQIFRHYSPGARNAFVNYLFYFRQKVSRKRQKEARHLLRDLENVVTELDALLDEVEGLFKEFCSINI